MKRPLTPPKLSNSHQLACGKEAKKTERQRMQKGVRIIFGNKFLMPKRPLILVPMLKIIKHKINDERPMSWKERSEICEPNVPIQLLM